VQGCQTARRLRATQSSGVDFALPAGLDWLALRSLFVLLAVLLNVVFDTAAPVLCFSLAVF
jgi:hypothetical protein